MKTRKERRHEYYLAHREKNHEDARRWRMTHPERAREIVRNSRKLHIDQAREAVRRWQEKHPEYARMWQKAHPEQMKEYSRRWKEAHPEGPKEAARKYRRNHPDRARAATKAWEKVHPDRMKLIGARHYARRKRELSTNRIIGLPAKNFVLHHMTPDIAVWIPEGLHKSLRHSMKDPESMKIINWRAMEWIANPDDRLLLKGVM